jgi:hypothetical protein
MQVKNLKLSGYLAITLLALLTVGSLSAYVLLSPARTWDNSPTYIVDNGGMSSISDGNGGVNATISAITSNQAWNGAGAGNVVGATSGNTNNVSLGDGTPMLVFDDPFHVCNGSCLAATFTGYYSQRNDGSYRIDDADIVTNTSYSWTSQNEDPNGSGCSGEFYIEGVMVHEVGHGLGLGHSNVNGATMYPSVASCDNGPASIASDDEAGINALYSGSGPGGGSCTLLPKGASCTSGSQCCSGNCKGKAGRKTCK